MLGRPFSYMLYASVAPACGSSLEAQGCASLVTHGDVYIPSPKRHSLIVMALLT